MNEDSADMWIQLDPGLKDSNSQAVFTQTARKLSEVQWSEDCLPEIQSIRQDQLEEGVRATSPVDRVLQVTINVMCDLKIQGWRFKVDGGSVFTAVPTEKDDKMAEKARIRAGHKLEKRKHLQQKSVRQFIHKMETRRQWSGSWTSIYSLMRDGRDLAHELERIAGLPDESSRHRALAETVSPYLQPVDDSIDPHTGISLKEIWRYFRNTWVNPPKTVPGRNIWFLVRDAAAENHPVMGIAAIASPVMKLGVRDDWIGWDSKSVLEDILSGNNQEEWSDWIEQSTCSLLDDIYMEDFIGENILDEKVIANPPLSVIDRLKTTSREARKLHQRYPDSSEPDADGSKDEWIAKAESPLYRAKRARTLADVLEARALLLAAGFEETPESLKQAAQDKKGQKGLKRILRKVRARHVGVDIMDITVCGAVPPYNPILGGKLVAQLMMSPQVVSTYRDRYCDSPSVIASAKAGTPITRQPQLVLLTTTSLYGVGSSQYNRVRVPVAEVGGETDEKVEYEELGMTEGYGSYHFSERTSREMQVLIAQSQEGRTVNSIFGEGISPRFRKIRQGLDLAGLPSDELLQHGNRRISYGVPLARNFRRVLLGLDKEPDYYLPTDIDPEETSRRIADYWRRRWLSMRIRKSFVLQRVAEHSTNEPVDHGAVVNLPAGYESKPLFNAT